MKLKGRIFLVDDDELIISMLARSLKKEGYETHIQSTARDVVTNISAWHPDIVLLDINLDENRSGLDILEELKGEGVESQVVMLTADDTAESAIRAMKLGAADYLTKPFNVDEVKLVIAGILEKERLRDEVNLLRESQGRSTCFSQDMVGESSVMKSVLAKAEKMAEANAPTILITGESGTGKELMARYVHNWRHLRNPEEGERAPFVTVNCTAIPDNLIENELFGHTKWSFTDAKTDKKGLFELANGGTMLLDEMGDMRIDLQSKLLRVLEDRKIRRLGGSTDVNVDVTVVATTNRDLKEAVRKGDFREDLFFRLNTFSLHLPPLRERKDDIPLLARHFLVHFSHQYIKKHIKGFSREAEELLRSYDWPGNIRELRNVVERCVVLENDEILQPEHLPLEFMGGTSKTAASSREFCITLPEQGVSLEEVEKSLISQALERAGNNQTKAAKLLQVSYDTLRYQAKKYGLV